MLPSTAPAGRGAASNVGRMKGEAKLRGPQSVPMHMWILWFALNSYLYWRYNAPSRSLLPRGEKIRLGEDTVVWQSPNREVELVLTPAAHLSNEYVWVLSAWNAFRGELVHQHAGVHLSLHPLRQMPLVQITRTGSSLGGPVHVKIATNKKRLTRNTFVSVLQWTPNLHDSSVFQFCARKPCPMSCGSWVTRRVVAGLGCRQP